jgi:hypothetical protein
MPKEGCWGREELLIGQVRAQALYPGLCRWAQGNNKYSYKRGTEGDLITIVGNVMMTRVT